ncbi:MAG: hemerythrin [Candidatus Glassbacteria bacterium RIFCSPLOWO2_12_FULL_58_11]|uniref:Hemerythrin n=1 Tax=Candidatus Glassbacteria bacterium RIFCSPLOWO2_12_FULL_58_11 TaxID=1817867 RepID=A0A1F5YJN5_9BACT|nr:MAG: hemerythrin [Candidatus Glassbacteria bacterium RIFCSPLOWO2_12_FULL_58_11]
MSVLNKGSFESSDRRKFLKVLASGTALALAGTAGVAHGSPETVSGGHGEEEVSPAEDLMREHGVLKRVMLVYEETLRRLHAGEELPPEALANAAGIIRSFIEDYHEKLEEDFLFPRFRKANKLVELVDILVEQHRAGRRLTDTTLRLSNSGALKNPDSRRELSDSLQKFIRMYSPHEAREDTVLFPAFRGIVSSNEYDSLGEEFEDKEHELFGEDGFDTMVDRVAAIEKSLGIFDLAQFTPKE